MTLSGPSTNPPLGERGSTDDWEFIEQDEYWACTTYELQEENARLRAVLQRIATQGLGRFDAHQLRIVSDADSALPWVHWATLAQEALDTPSPT